MDEVTLSRKGSLKAIGEEVRSPGQKKLAMEKKLVEAQSLVAKMKEEQLERKKREKQRRKDQQEHMRLEMAKAEEMKA